MVVKDFYINKTEVMVFKTNAPESLDNQMVTAIFNGIEGIEDWNFDLEDCDRILRVVAYGKKPLEIIELLKMVGIEAWELPDD